MSHPWERAVCAIFLCSMFAQILRPHFEFETHECKDQPNTASNGSMFVQISNGTGAQCEWCLLEFQGEVLGELAGNELGQLELKEVCETSVRVLSAIAINPD
jgi:hypothetical protein